MKKDASFQSMSNELNQRQSWFVHELATLMSWTIDPKKIGSIFNELDRDQDRIFFLNQILIQSDTAAQTFFNLADGHSNDISDLDSNDGHEDGFEFNINLKEFIENYKSEFR